MALEMPCEVALIGEAGFGSNVGGGHAIGQHRRGPMSPERDQISVRRKAELAPECTNDLITASLRQAAEIVEHKALREMPPHIRKDF